MSELRTVRAAKGRRVVTPVGAAVPAGGFRVDPRDPWWARALASGDVVALTEAEIEALKAGADEAETGHRAATGAADGAADKAQDEAAMHDQGGTAGAARVAVAAGGTAGNGEMK